MSKLKLTVNENRTCICKVADETFDLVDYIFGGLTLRGPGKVTARH